MSFVKLEPGAFPSLLKQINDPPKVLYLEGKIPSEDNKWLCVVGSRKFSRYGQDACQKLVGELAGYPVVIVSGLALGIDTIAHKTALKAGLKTIAIPGSGLDRSVLHPHSNRRLADEIVESGGALLSELDPTEPAGVHTFPRRNRIMAGLAHAVLIIEAGDKSGTLITARLATDYNREVMVIPGSIFSPTCAGSNRLINQGAHPVTCGSDILQVLGFDVAEQPKLKLQDLTPDEKRVIEILTDPMSRDDLVVALNLPVSAANTLLSVMEIKGIIKESLGEIRINSY